MTSADELLDEAEAQGFEGWDFTRLGDRLTLTPPHWDLEGTVAARAAAARNMLDMGTGGGEWLASLAARAPATVATESWPPNVGVAAARLRPLEIGVVHSEGAVDNHLQAGPEVGGRLPFRSAAFDLVSNRHEAFNAAEVARVLRPGGWFVTQQAHSGTVEFHRVLGLAPPRALEFDLELAVEQVRLAGLEVAVAEKGTAVTTFADIGALAWYLKSVPWAVPGFTIDRHRGTLLSLHRQAPIPISSTRFWLQASKPGAAA
ncbi:MAG TPA: class I SAM-dependent methyltransferase [Acidimicrobiales bacterium]|nr:class I SAM-dependent methyltransferase [Acidimicrobiales bacterium]